MSLKPVFEVLGTCLTSTKSCSNRLNDIAQIIKLKAGTLREVLAKRRDTMRDHTCIGELIQAHSLTADLG